MCNIRLIISFVPLCKPILVAYAPRNNTMFGSNLVTVEHCTLPGCILYYSQKPLNTLLYDEI